MTDVKRLLFVCVENSNRSQMAEAFGRLFGGANVEVFSAGSRPSGRVNPKAVDAMKALGYDLTKHQSSSLEDLPDVTFDAVVTMGCGDACPQIQTKLRDDWSIPDPKSLPADEFAEVRDMIAARVTALLGQLGVESSSPIL